MLPQADGMAAYTAVPLSNINPNILLEPQGEGIIVHTAVPLPRRRQAASVVSNITHHGIVVIEDDDNQGDDNSGTRVSWSTCYCMSSILSLGVLSLAFIVFGPFGHV